MKYTTDRPFADPDKAARRLMQHAHALEVVQDGRIYIEKLNGPFLFGDKGTPAEYSAGLKLAIDRGWLDLHESGTYVTFTAPTCSPYGWPDPLKFARACFGTERHHPTMPYRIHAKVKDGAFSVVVETAKDALAKLAELAESEHNEVAAMDLSGTVIELATLQAEANQAP